MIIRPMLPSDIERGLELCRMAGWNQVRADWDYFLAHAACITAEAADGVLGTCAVLDSAGPTAWIAMLLVDPVARGQGIGTRLLEHTLAGITATSIGLDATAPGRPLYEKYGFLPSAEIVRWWREPAVHLPLRQGSPAHWRAGYTSNQIGPIISDSVADACAQTVACIGTDSGRGWILDVPCQAPPAWRAWLAANGFTPQRPLSRMYRGLPRPLTPEVLATSGPEYGHRGRFDF